MFSKRKIYSFFIFIILVFITLTVIKPTRKCTQCGYPIYVDNYGESEPFRESLLAMIFSPNTSFLHLICVEDYFKDNPIERDSEGKIIPKT